jgi:hypothetical protein
MVSHISLFVQQTEITHANSTRIRFEMTIGFYLLCEGESEATPRKSTLESHIASQIVSTKGSQKGEGPFRPKEQDRKSSEQLVIKRRITGLDDFERRNGAGDGAGTSDTKREVFSSYHLTS